MEVRLLGGIEGRSSNVSSESCINLYYEKAENGESLVNTPGSSEFADLGAGEVRGGIRYNGNAWFVCGNTLYELDSAGNSTSRGTLSSSSGLVSLAHNGTRTGSNQQIFIADGESRYIYDNLTGVLTRYTDYAAERVVFIDGYFLFTITDTDEAYITGLYDGANVDPTDIFTAEGSPDKTRGLVADQRQVYVWGENSMEVFYNSGDADTPFQQFQSGFKQMGCAASFTPQRFDNTMVWLTANERGEAQVAAVSGDFNPTIISTAELDYQLAQYSTISDAFAYSYQYEGNEFYTLVFPSEGKTWVFNARTKRWHAEGHTIDGTFPNRVRYNCHVVAFGKHLLGDKDNGKIYQLDSTLGTLAGARVPREVKTPVITDEEQRIRISSAQLDMEEGTGDPNVTTDTSMWLSYSKNGGNTYGNEIEASIGDAGEYKRRVIWRKLGWGRNWNFRLRTWTPNKVVMKGLYLKPYGRS